MTKVNTIIIGGGPSGLAAGVRLFKNGMSDFVILEAENRIGGRINSVDFGEYRIDLGAQWCHGSEGNVVYEMCNTHTLLDHSKDGHFDTGLMFVKPNGAFIDENKCKKVLDFLENLTDNIAENDYQKYESLGEFYLNKLEEKRKNGYFNDIDSGTIELVLRWFRQYVIHYEGCDDWSQLSLKGSQDFKQCPGDQIINWKDRTYSAFLETLTANTNVKEKVILNKEVVKIDWTCENSNTVRVTCANGEQFLANQVLVTVSLGVLKNKMDQLFIPALPKRKQEVIKSLHIGCVNKIFLTFPHKWWPDNCTGFNFTINAEEQDAFLEQFDGSKEDNRWLLDVFGFYVIDHRPMMLLGWIIGDSARQLETVPTDEAKSKIMQLIYIFLAKKFNIPEPDHFTCSKWSSNPHFSGSYSCRTVEAERKRITHSELGDPVENSNGDRVLLFAGEATHAYYFSTVHGAVESGFREADRILEMHKKCQN